MNDIKLLNRAADNIRILSAAMVEKAKSGHPGGARMYRSFHHPKPRISLPVRAQNCRPAESSSGLHKY